MVSDEAFVSLTAAGAACLAAVPVFVAAAAARVPYFHPSVMPVACVWALASTFPLLSETWVFVRRSLVASWVGAGGAFLLASLGPEVRLTALVLSFPLPFLYSLLCDPSCRTPWSCVLYPPLAALIHYGILAFGPADPWDCASLALTYALTFDLGALAALLSHCVFSSLLRRRRSLGATGTCSALRDCLELMSSAIEGVVGPPVPAFQAELRGRVGDLNAAIAKFDAAAAAWGAEFWSARPSRAALSAVRSALVGWHAVLSGLLEASEGKPSAELRAILLDSLGEELQDMRQTLVFALDGLIATTDSGRGSSKSVGGDEVAQRVHAADEAGERLVMALAARQRDLLLSEEAVAVLRGVPAEDVAGTTFAIAALRRMPALLDTLSEAVKASRVGELARRPAISCRLAASDLRAFLADARSPQKYFEAAPADAILDGALPPSVWRRAKGVLKYPFRFTLALHIGALALLWFSAEVKGSDEYRLWALVPTCMCFLPSTGAAIQKSMRLVVGTLLGGALAVGCIYWSPHSEWVYYSELLLVSFIAKYASTFPQVGYGGLVFGFVWFIVALRAWDAELPTAQRIEFALWRIAMSTSGVVFTIVCSVVLLPNHATRDFEHRSAECLLCTSEVVLVWSRAAFALKSGTEATALPSDVSENLEPEEVHVAFSSLEACARSSLPQRLALLAEAGAERQVVSRVFADLTDLQASLGGLSDLAEAIRRIAPLAIDSGADLAGATPSTTAAEEEAAEGGATADSQHLLQAAPHWGPVLQRNVGTMREVIRQSTLSIALRLRGVRAPVVGTGCGTKKLKRSLRNLRHSFEMARREALGSSLGVSLASGGSREFYISVFGLCRFAARLVELEERTAAAVAVRLPAEKAPGAGGPSRSAPRDSTTSCDSLESVDEEIYILSSGDEADRTPGGGAGGRRKQVEHLA